MTINGFKIIAVAPEFGDSVSDIFLNAIDDSFLILKCLINVNVNECFGC